MHSQQHRCTTHSAVSTSTDTKQDTSIPKLASYVRKHHTDPTKTADRITSGKHGKFALQNTVVMK
ncbi:hypothetical protein CWC18_16850 [Pseudoalteromonas aurantia]|nr:hypothetical protein CWC18_16850 [Pseudoalteromonas aurantia]